MHRFIRESMKKFEIDLSHDFHKYSFGSKICLLWRNSRTNVLWGGWVASCLKFHVFPKQQLVVCSSWLVVCSSAICFRRTPPTVYRSSPARASMSQEAATLRLASIPAHWGWCTFGVYVATVTCRLSHLAPLVNVHARFLETRHKLRRGYTEQMWLRHYQ